VLGEAVVVVVATDGLRRIPRRAVTEMAGTAVDVDSLTSDVTVVVVPGFWVVLLRPAKSETDAPPLVGDSVD
jgi:hypothetical protein